MAIITKAFLQEGTGGEPVTGEILLKGYSIAKTKNGAEYVTGKLQSGDTISFKAWGNSDAFKELKNYDYNNTVVHLTGSFDNYSGILSIVVDTITAIDNYSPAQFMEERYQMDTYKTALISLCQQSLSPKGMMLINKILFENKELMDRFCEEFAASTYHDNCLHGLLVHTYKVFCLATWALSTYPALVTTKVEDEQAGSTSDRKDLIYIGVLLHDIGKTQEMQYGVYQRGTAVTHRVLGLDVLYTFKDDIVSAYSLDWFRLLQSIIVEHHGEFGSPCNTVVSEIVHNLDMLDSRLTGLSQDISNNKCDSTSGEYINFEGKRLFI